MRAGTIECMLQFHSDLGFVFQNEDQQASEGPLQDATCYGKSVCSRVTWRKIAAH